MNRKTVILIVILILVPIALFYILNILVLKRRGHTLTASALIQKSITQAETPLDIKIEEPKLVIENEETTKTSCPFWGNRGYLIKDGKSTFVKPSELLELKKDFEKEFEEKCQKYKCI